MNNQGESQDILSIVCRFISSRKILDNFKMEINIEWTNKEIEKAVKFFNTNYENDYLKMEQIQFIILGKLLEDNVTLQEHLEQNYSNQQKEQIEYEDCIELDVFMNFSPIDSIQCQQKQKDLNTQRLYLMVETITQMELGCLQSRKKFNDDFYELYKKINFNLLQRKDHGYYFLIQNYISQINLPSIKQKEFKLIKNKLTLSVVNRELYFQGQQSNQDTEIKKLDEMQIFTKIKNVIFFMYRNNLLLPFIILQLVLSMYFYNYIFITAILISILNYNTEFFVDHANDTQIKKKYFQDCKTHRKIFLIVLETLLNSFLSIGFGFDCTKTKGKFQKFLKNFEEQNQQDKNEQMNNDNNEQSFSKSSDQSNSEEQHHSTNNDQENISGDDYLDSEKEVTDENYNNENQILDQQIKNEKDMSSNEDNIYLNEQEIENYIYDLAEKEQIKLQQYHQMQKFNKQYKY